MSKTEQMIEQTGIPARAGGYTSPPPFPHISYFDRREVSGDDFHNRLCSHEVQLELYNDGEADDPRGSIAKTEKAVEAILDAEGIHYLKKPAAYLKSERTWETIYIFEFLEVM